MARPQSGIFVEGTTAHWFQEFDIARSADPAAVSEAIAAAVAAGSDLAVVVGLGPDLVARLGVEPADGFRAFETVGAGDRRATATQHDLFVWFHGHARDDTFDAALAARRAVTEVGAIVGDVSAFIYRDGRDLTGFIDGTENPPAEEGRELAVVADGLPGAGGSVVLVQRWVHDLDRFHALPVDEQEGVIGRTRADSVELDEEVMPETAHVARVVMEDDDGDEIEIYRRSVPWGDSTEAGLVFIGFTDQLTKIDDMLHAMYGTVDGIQDRLTEFSRARASSYYFVPSEDSIRGLVG